MHLRLLHVKLKLDGEVGCIVSAYGPGSEKEEVERELFRADLEESLRDLGTGVNVLLMGDLDAGAGNEIVDGVAGRYGVPGKMRMESP